MKIAVTSQDRKTITGHAGKCRKFWIYEIDDKTILKKSLLELTLDQSLHASQGAGPHPLDGINVLISEARMRTGGILDQSGARRP